jgi:hypothetical protein
MEFPDQQRVFENFQQFDYNQWVDLLAALHDNHQV